jgi:hypothetical protein
MAQRGRFRRRLLAVGSGVHLCAEAGLGVVAPVLAVELDEDRGVGDGQGGFEDEDVEGLSGLVDAGDDLFVRERLDRVAAQEIGYLCTVGGDTGCVLIGDKGQFGIHEDVRAHVDGVVDGVEDGCDDFELAGAGLDGFDAGRGLERVG